jgi:hypothetical protein
MGTDQLHFASQRWCDAPIFTSKTSACCRDASIRKIRKKSSAKQIILMPVPRSYGGAGHRPNRTGLVTIETAELKQEAVSAYGREAKWSVEVRGGGAYRGRTTSPKQAKPTGIRGRGASAVVSWDETISTTIPVTYDAEEKALELVIHADPGGVVGSVSIEAKHILLSGTTPSHPRCLAAKVGAGVVYFSFSSPAIPSMSRKLFQRARVGKSTVSVRSSYECRDETVRRRRRPTNRPASHFVPETQPDSASVHSAEKQEDRTKSKTVGERDSNNGEGRLDGRARPPPIRTALLTPLGPQSSAEVLHLQPSPPSVAPIRGADEAFVGEPDASGALLTTLASTSPVSAPSTRAAEIVVMDFVYSKGSTARSGQVVSAVLQGKEADITLAPTRTWTDADGRVRATWNHAVVVLFHGEFPSPLKFVPSAGGVANRNPIPNESIMLEFSDEGKSMLAGPEVRTRIVGVDPERHLDGPQLHVDAQALPG